MDKLFRALRVITIPPVFAMALLLTVYFARSTPFMSPLEALLGVLFLAVLPALAYPLQKYIPHFRDKGREGQRSLAMLFSAAGYLLGLVTAFATEAPINLCVIYLEYLLCGIVLLLFNKGFHLRASGHACGIVGPVSLLLYFELYVPAVIGALLIIPVLVSSVKTGRHTVGQLVGGCLIAAMCLLLIVFLLSAF